MDIEMLSYLAAIAGLCVVSVNIIVEVLKSSLLRSETARPPVVLIVSEITAFFTMYLYCCAENVPFSFLTGIGAFAGGFFIAYGAMFGYEKLYGELLNGLERFLKNSD